MVNHFFWFNSGHPAFTTARLCPHSCECWASICEAWEYGFSEASALCLVLNPLNPALQNWDTLPKTNSSHLKMDGWKMKFPFGMAYFQGWTVSFREGNCCLQLEFLPILPSLFIWIIGFNSKREYHCEVRTCSLIPISTWLQVMVVAPGAGTGLNGEVYKELGHLDWNYPPGNDHRCPPKIPQKLLAFFEDDFFIFSQGGICWSFPGG